MRKAKNRLVLLLSGAMMLSCIACGAEPTAPAPQQPSAQASTKDPQTVEQVSRLVAEEKYEEAYLILKDLDGAEADTWKKKLVYLPTTGYEYDEQNRLIRMVAPQFTEEYTYDDRGNLLRETTTWDDGDVTMTENVYDDAGRCISYRLTYEDETWDNVCTYNDAGLLERVDSKTTNLDEQKIENSVYYYNDQGEEIGYTYTDFLGRPFGYFNTYDDKGNLISAKTLDRSKVIVQNYTYNDQGKMLTINEIQYDEEVYSGVYTYDDQGRCLTYTETGGNYVETERFTYDDQGNCVRYQYDQDSPDKDMEQHYVVTTQHTHDAYGRQLDCVETCVEEGKTEITQTTYVYTATGYTKTVTVTVDGEKTVETETWKLTYFPEGIPKDMEHLIETE